MGRCRLDFLAYSQVLLCPNLSEVLSAGLQRVLSLVRGCPGSARKRCALSRLPFQSGLWLVQPWAWLNRTQIPPRKAPGASRDGAGYGTRTAAAPSRAGRRLPLFTSSLFTER